MFCLHECIFDGQNLINKTSKRKIKAIVVVHIFGNMADMEKIMAIAKTYNLKVVEDATEALGTFYTKGPYKGKFAGTIGDVGVYSFNGNKIITTGGGGMIVSNDQNYLVKAKHLTTQAKVDEIYFTHDEIGYNYRMTNLQAALGIAQLEFLETFIQIKKDNYQLYKDLFNQDQKYTLLAFESDIRPNYWFYSLVGLNQKINIKVFIELMKNKNTQVRPVWGLIHKQKPYISSQAYQISKAYDYVDKVINIPCSSNLTQDDVRIVYNRIRDI
jgi:dTDP-4-amino-4,6-dideoxygalactose transaminase